MKEMTKSYLIIAALCVGFVFIWWLVPFPFSLPPKLVREDGGLDRVYERSYRTWCTVANESKRDWEGIVRMKIIAPSGDEVWRETWGPVRVKSFELRSLGVCVPASVIEEALLDPHDHSDSFPSIIQKLIVEWHWGETVVTYMFRRQ